MERIRKNFSVGGCRAEESVMVAIRCNEKKDALLSYDFSYLKFAITVKGARFDGKEAKKKYNYIYPLLSIERFAECGPFFFMWTTEN